MTQSKLAQSLRRISWPLLIKCVVLLSFPLQKSGAANDAYQKQQNQNAPTDFLDDNSVVLITGIAGFIGSELAMALHRVYSPKKIIGVDSMDDGFGQNQGRTPEDLGVFDFKRQRLFHLLQTVGARCHFYRVDFRPNIPDYQDRGEVPVLDHIFASHPDITHVVHLADPYGMPSLLEEGDDEVKLSTQAVPRKKEQMKAGMMESLLEQLYKAGKLHPHGRTPHFTFASSAHVYSHYTTDNDQVILNPPPFDEVKPIATPSSIHGASKLLDEILAKTYHESREIYSIGIRFFDVYGPWGSPGSFLFDLAERAVRGGDFVSDEELQILDKASRDYLYIEDAVDALLAAMQFRPLPPKPDQAALPVVINAGTGHTTTARAIVQTMQKYLTGIATSKLPPPKDLSLQTRHSISFASTTRAKQLLGFEPRFSLEEGIFHLLSWHHDRAFPYGSLDPSSSNAPRHPLETLGMAACSPFDVECLKGSPVFPCASECSNRHQCTPSFYDSVVGKTRQWTAPCDAVLYTVNLDDDLMVIPSASAAVSTTSQSHVISEEGQCNLAFVSSSSPLAQNIGRRDDNSSSLKHGLWTLVLVDVQEDQRSFFLEFLPKLSPGLFFGGGKTKRIIYCDPDVIINSIPNLLAEAAMQPMYQPHHDDDQKDDTDDTKSKKDKNLEEGATAMIIGKGRQSQSRRKGHMPLQEAVQDMAYRSVRISVIDQMSGDGFALSLDSSFIVHTLQSEDSRLFRCDVFGELIQWDVGTDQSAFQFVLELHDMWSSVIAKKSGLKPWWVGEGVVTIPERRQPFLDGTGASQKRRLLVVEAHDPGAESEQGKTSSARGIQLVKVQNENEAEVALDAGGDVDVDLASNPADVKRESVQGKIQAAPAKRDTNFGDSDDQITEQAQGDANAEVIAARENEDKDDDAMIDDDAKEDEAGDVPSRPEVHGQARDISSHDTWMGVLSSTSRQYFVRIVPSSEAGVVVLDD